MGDLIQKDDESKNTSLLKYQEEANEAEEAEKQLCLKDAIKKHNKAIFWSAALSLTIVMEAYDVGLIYQFFAYPSFQRQFGNYYENIGWQVSSPWQAGLTNGANCGIIIGGFLNGYLSQRFGYKKVVLASLFILNWLIFLFFFSKTTIMLLFAQLLAGLTWGVFATSGPAYASEVCPLTLRGYLTNYVNLCWCIGQLIAAGALYGLLKFSNEWGYRIAYGLQWIWPLPLFCILAFAPESPWYLVKSGSMEKAYDSVSKLDNSSEEEKRKKISQIIHTLEVEKEIESGTSYFDLFKGIDLRRTEIVCMAFAGQILSGSNFTSPPTYFFEQAGIPTDKNYEIQVGATAMNFVCTIFSWFLLNKFGRRTLYLVGMAACCLSLLIIGILACIDAQKAKWGQVGMCFVWLASFSMTVGPITYTIISETSSMHLRTKSVCISRNVYNLIAIISNIVQPLMLNPTKGNWKGRTGFFWCGTSLATLIWAYFRLPELKGRTYEEADIMFYRNISARKFANYKIEIEATAIQEKKVFE